MQVVNNQDNTQPAISNTEAWPFYLSVLRLNNFRNYSALTLEFDVKPVVITGANGAGKTNILEAISLLSPGKGLRRIKISEADKITPDGPTMPWSISATVNKADEETQVGTGRQRVEDSKRIVRIDGDTLPSQAELANIFSVMWLTPQMDGLFIGSSSDRRKFLDRLVYNFDPEHASRIYSYEYTMRERAKLLQGSYDPAWIAVLEGKMAERAVSIAAARIDAIDNIQAAVMQLQTAFPKANIAVDGGVENIMQEYTALQAEELIRQQLADARQYDRNTGRTSIGTHRSDFVVVHIDKNMPAASCSTGEQKDIIIIYNISRSESESGLEEQCAGVVA